MALYDLAFTKTTGAAAGLLAQLRTGSARDVRLFEVGIFATTAVSGAIGLIRPSAVGATFTSVGPGIAEDPITGAGVTLIDTAATTAPTIGGAYMRQITLPATIGAGIVWTFPSGIVVPVSASLAIWQTSAAAVGYAGYFAFSE